MPGFGIRHVTFFQLSETAPEAESKRALIEEGAKAVELKIERLLPDNPLRIDETFANYTPEQMTRYGFKVRDLFRPSQPQRPRGRPKKVANTEPTVAGKWSINLEDAKRAYRLSLDGKDRKTITRTLFPNLIPEERRARKVEKQVNRLIERGHIEHSKLNKALKKDGRNK